MFYLYFCFENAETDILHEKENYPEEKNLVNEKTDENNLFDTKTEEEKEFIQELFDSENHFYEAETDNKETNAIEEVQNNKSIDENSENFTAHNQEKQEVKKNNNSFTLLLIFITSFLLFKIVTSSFLNSLIIENESLDEFYKNENHKLICTGYCFFNINITKLLIKINYLKLEELNVQSESEINHCKHSFNPSINKVSYSILIIVKVISLISLILFIMKNNDTEEKVGENRDKFFLYSFYSLLGTIILLILSLVFNCHGIPLEKIFNIILGISLISKTLLDILVLIYSVLYFQDMLNKAERTQEEELLVYSLSIYYVLVLLSVLFFGKRKLNTLIKNKKHQTKPVKKNN